MRDRIIRHGFVGLLVAALLTAGVMVSIPAASVAVAAPGPSGAAASYAAHPFSAASVVSTRDARVAAVAAAGVSPAGRVWPSAGAFELTGGGGALQVVPEPVSARLGVPAVVVQLPRGRGGAVSVPRARLTGLFGADWAWRARWVELVGCDAGLSRCVSQRPLPPAASAVTGRSLAGATARAGTPDVARVSATIPAVTAARAAASVSAPGAAPAVAGAGTVVSLALVAGPSGTTGSFTATDLTQASSWSAGGNSGDFSWQYTFASPDVPGGLAPQVAVGYSSGSIDGRVASSNNQGGFVGDGWSLSGSGSVERRYVPCAQDMTGSNTTTKTGDLCWKDDNAVLSLGGHSGELVKAADGTWRLLGDDGSKIERLTLPADRSNGDRLKQYWRLTTTDGTKYYFGVGQRYTGDTDATNSVWTVPVFGNQTGEPCNQATFAASWCDQSWRWNLDYVEDLHGNTMSYFYEKETNQYARNLTATTVSSYVRGGYPVMITYGQRAGATRSNAGARVVFTVADRTKTVGTTTTWPDVPLDLVCDSTTTCPGKYAPAFFTRKRLATVTTQVTTTTAGTFTDVDTWALTHTFPDPGDGTNATLWLASIQRTAKAGTTPITMMANTFGGSQLPNRVDGLDMAPPMNRWRVNSINTETGAQIVPHVMAAECVAGSNVPTDPSTNTKRCFPVYFTPDGYADPIMNYFHKYVVDSVAVNDTLTGAKSTYTSYAFTGSPAWHYDNDTYTPPAYRTWSDWRGYAKVTTSAGMAPDPVTATTLTYLRGMNGDHLPTGTRTVTVTDSFARPVTDDNAFAGYQLESEVTNGVGGALISRQVNTPWKSAATAGSGDKTAYLTDTAITRTAAPLSTGTLRTTTTTTTFDQYGMPATTVSAGDDATPGDETCVATEYTRNTTSWLLTPVKATTSYPNTTCSGTPQSGTRTLYDTGAWGATPTLGDPTETQVLATAPATYVRTGTTTYDGTYGRALSVTDAAGGTTSTAFTPTTGMPVTAITVTNNAGHTARTDLDPVRGQAVKTTDANGKITETTYDALGRLTQGWLPTQSRAGGAQPAVKISYSAITTGQPYVVSTSGLKKDTTGYLTTTTFTDGLGRHRQTQSPDASGAGNRTITDSSYDSRGNLFYASGPRIVTGPPATTMDGYDGVTERATRTLYDNANRTTAVISLINGTEYTRTTTRYDGAEATTTLPPTGATATTTLTDALGRTIAIRTHKTNPPSAAGYDTTSYTYTPQGQLAGITDPAGTHWSYTYDLRGRRTTSIDPDHGTTTTTYDNADRPTTITSYTTSDLTQIAHTLTYSYEPDKLGRRTAEQVDGTTTAEWTYDPVGALGQPATSTAIIDGQRYTRAVTKYSPLYQPMTATLTLPGTENGLTGAAAGTSYTYTTTATYTYDGAPKTLTQPAAGNLPAETLTYSYDTMDRPKGLTGNGSIVGITGYTPLGELQRIDQGSILGKGHYTKYVYESGTHRLLTTTVRREPSTTDDITTQYRYDLAGKILSITDTTSAGNPGAGTDTQCFTYDYLQRLTRTHTPATNDCTTTPTTWTSLGGPAPYWQDYTYDTAGNRKTLTTTTAAGTTTYTYTYPTPDQPHPHAVTAITATGATTPARGQGTYTYDPQGNTTTRPDPTTGTQTLTYDAHDRLATLTNTTGTTTNLYDTDGQLLITKEPTQHTLYLDGTEILWNKNTNTRTTTRYYTWLGTTIAARTTTGLTTLIPDPHNTATTQITHQNLTITRRYTDPFGAPRGPTTPLLPPTWTGTHTFLDKPHNTTTGLTHISARDYDPLTGRFLTTDPLLTPTNPTTLNPYTYTNHNPINATDPTGLFWLTDLINTTVTTVTQTIHKAHQIINRVLTKYREQSHYLRRNAADREYDRQTSAAGAAHEQAVKATASHTPAAVPTCLDSISSLDCAPSTGSAGGFVGVDTLGALSDKDAREIAEAQAQQVGESGKIILELALPTTCFREGVGWGCALDIAAYGGGPVLKLVKMARLGKAAKATEALADAARTACFTAGTPVLLADGTSKPIEQVAVGDAVTAYDPDTGTIETRDVVRTFVHHDVPTYDVTLDTGEKVTTTSEHPFWVGGQGWTPATQLRAGDRLHQPDGTTAQVASVQATGQTETVYNFEVQGLHDYYVKAGNTWILVHNDCRGLWTLTKEGSSSMMRGGPFRTTFYKSGSDGTWWTKDVAGHGGSAFKVYRETDKGLEWIKDADKYGDYIGDKWKGGTGRFISWNDLAGVG